MNPHIDIPPIWWDEWWKWKHNWVPSKDLTEILDISQGLPLDTYSFGHSSLQVSPERWASLPSLILDGVEIFYNDAERRNNPQKNIREGFWMWPQAGPFSQEQLKKYWYNLKQHGFLRDVAREKDDTTENIVYDFETNTKSLERFSHSFLVSQEIKLWDKKAEIGLQIQNLSVKDMSFAPWHHTFYKVAPEQKKDILLDPNMQVSEEMKKTWLSWEHAVKIANPGYCEVYIPGIGKLGLTFDSQFRNLWLWTEKDKWFVCIEPVVCHPSEWEEKALVLKYGENTRLQFSIELLEKDSPNK